MFKKIFLYSIYSFFIFAFFSFSFISRENNYENAYKNLKEFNERELVYPGDKIVQFGLGRSWDAALIETAEGEQEIWSWGDNYYGQLGVGTSGDSFSSPVRVDLSGVLTEEGDTITQFNVGPLNMSIIVEDTSGNEEVWMTGYNAKGQVGNGTKVNATSNFTQTDTSSMLSSGSTITSLLHGDEFSGALVENSSGEQEVWMWGDNFYAQYGNDIGGNSTSVNSTVPKQIILNDGTNDILEAGDTISDLSLGGYYSGTVIEKNDGSQEVWTWGKNDLGQLGNGTTVSYPDEEPDVFPPTQVETSEMLSGNRKVVDLALIRSHGAALINNDGVHEIWGWGSNANGQIGDGSDVSTNSIVPKHVDTSSFLGEGDSVRELEVGHNNTGVLIDTVEGSQEIWMWGDNSSGQLGIGGDTDSNVPVQVDLSSVLSDSSKEIVHFEIGNFHTQIIVENSDGTQEIWGWGRNTSGQLGNGTEDSVDVPTITDETLFVTADVSTSNVTDTTIDVNWNVDNGDSTITSISIQDSTQTIYEVTDPMSNLSGTDTITGLTPEETYDDWKLVIEHTNSYGDVQTPVETQFDSFTMNPVPFVTPVINSITATNVTDTTIDVSWNITDTSGAITSIAIVGSEVSENVTLLGESVDGIISGTTTITDLTPEVTYGDWKLVVEWNDEFGEGQENVEASFDSFTTNPTPLIAPTISSVSYSEVTYNSVKIDWEIVDVDSTITSITISGTGVDQDVTSEGIVGSTTISGLTAEATYSDWKLVVEWNNEYELAQTAVEASIDSFTTNPIPVAAPTITSVATTDITYNSVVVNWEIVDVDSTITSITIQNTTETLYTVTDPTSNLISSTTLNGLEGSTTYSDWMLVITWNDEFGDAQTQIQEGIDSFTTEPTPVVAPTITSVVASEATYNSIKIDWSVVDADDTITSITISGTGVDQNVTSMGLISSTTIAGLTPESTYSDWKLVVEWNNEYELAQTAIELEIAEFTTEPEPVGVPVISSVVTSEITYNSVRIDWEVLDEDNTATSISIQDSTGVIEELGMTLSGNITINDLSSETTYGDWKLVVEWNDEFGDPQTPTEFTINSFTTLPTPVVAPTIESITTSELTHESVKVNWSIIDADETITSITISGTGVNQDVTDIGLSGETTIDGLSGETTYSDWKLVVEWNNEYEVPQTAIEFEIAEFTTEITPFVPPVINSITIQDITTTSVSISWDITADEGSITSIRIENSAGFTKDLGTSTTGSITIDGLSPETTYDDWTLIVEWNNELGDAQEAIETPIDSITTIAEPKVDDNNEKSNWFIYFAIAILALVIIIIIVVVIMFVRR